MLLLLHIATVYTRATRHLALRAVQELVADSHCPLPLHELLQSHLDPLLHMITGLCKRRKMSCAVVQIGITLLADLIQRYRDERPMLRAPGE